MSTEEKERAIFEELDRGECSQQGAADKLGISLSTLKRKRKGIHTLKRGRPVKTQKSTNGSRPQSHQQGNSGATAKLPLNPVAAPQVTLKTIFNTNIVLTAKLKAKNYMVIQSSGDYLEYTEKNKCLDGTTVYRCHSCRIGTGSGEIASIRVSGTGQIIGPHDPVHRCVPAFLTLSEVIVREVGRRARLRVCKNDQEPRQAWLSGQKQCLDIASEHGFDVEGPNSLAVMYRPWETVNTQFHRLRQDLKNLNKLDFYEDIFLSQFAMTTIGNLLHSQDPKYKWVIGTSKQLGVVIFASRKDLQVLSESKHYQSDATFKIAPQGFRQVFTIHCLYHDEWCAVVTALMEEKKEAAYDFILSTIKDECRKEGLTLSPVLFLTDFELAEMNAVSKAFGSTILKGCSFHFSQALLKQVKSHTLWQFYSKDKANTSIIYKWIRRIMALCFLPPVLVPIIWDKCLSLVPLAPPDWAPPKGCSVWPTTKLLAFKTYFEKTYLKSSFYPIEVWNHFQSGSHRTTNASEAYHSAASRNSGAFSIHPTRSKFIADLQSHHASQQIRIDQLEKGEPPRRRNVAYATMDEKLQELQFRFKVMFKKRIDDRYAIDSAEVVFEATEYLYRCSHVLSDLDVTGTVPRKQNKQPYLKLRKSVLKKALTPKKPFVKRSLNVISSASAKVQPPVSAVIGSAYSIISWGTKKYHHTCPFDNIMQMIFGYFQENNVFIAKGFCNNNADNGFSTSVYRKTSFSGRLQPFDSYTSKAYLLSSLKTYLIRAKRYCSNDESYRAEEQYIRELFKKNGYPAKVIERQIRDTKFSRPKAKQTPMTKLPMEYSGPLFYKLRSLARNFCNVDLVATSSNNAKSGILSKCKAKIPSMKASNVIYGITCECGSMYIGETGRTLEIRVKEHESAWRKVANRRNLSIANGSISSRTRAHSKPNESVTFPDAPPTSAFCTHQNCLPNFRNTTVIGHERNKDARKLKEGIWIQRMRGERNVMPSPNDINRNSGVDLPNSWIPPISNLKAPQLL